MKRYLKHKIGSRWDYEPGTIWIMPQTMTEQRDPDKPNEKGIMVPLHRPTYIIITGPTWVQDESTPTRDLVNRQLDSAELSDDLIGFDDAQKSIYRYKLDPNCRICFTWYMGSLRKLTGEQLTAFKIALAEAMETLQERHHKEQVEFKNACEVIKMWPPILSKE